MPSIIKRCLLQIAAVAGWETIYAMYLVSKLSSIQTNMALAGWKGMESMLGLPSSNQIVALLAIMLAALGIAAWGILERANWAPWPILFSIILLAFGLLNLFSWVCIVEMICLGNAFYELISDEEAVDWLKGSAQKTD